MAINGAEDSVLLVVDIQEKLASHIAEGRMMIKNTARLVKAAKKLDIPVVVTEHYRKGLGPTVEALQPLIGGCRIIEKIHFAATEEADLKNVLRKLGRSRIQLTGSETHVCVMQTAIGLKSRGFIPSIVEDASSSCRLSDKETGLRRMIQEGVLPVSTEMLMFEWLGRGNTGKFRDILAIIKS